MKFLWAGVAAFLVAGAMAHGTPLDDKAKAFGEALTAAAKASPNAALGRGNWMTSVPAVMAALRDESQGGSQVDMTISQMMSQFPDSQTVQDTGQAFLDQVRADRKAKEDAARQKLAAVLQPLPETLKKAEKPEDLDATLRQLQEAAAPRLNGGMGSAELQRLSSRIQEAQRFVQGWQDYLSNLQAGNLQEAQGSLRNLTGNDSEGLIPRSELLARINDLGAQLRGAPPAAAKPTPPDLFAQVKALDDLAPVAAEAHRPSPGGPNPAAAVLDNYAAVYGGVKSGVPTSIPVEFNTNLNSPDYFRVKAMLYLYVMPRYLETASAPRDGESPLDYVHRATAEATAKGDWKLLKRSLELQRALHLDVINGQAGSPSLSNLQAAFNQEEAGQYALAVQSYQQALRIDDASLPTKLIGQRLDAIKKDHPQEFEQGMQLVLNPPAPRYPAGYPYLPGSPQTMALQQMQAAQAQAQAQVQAQAAAASAPILIPGTNNPTAKPAPPVPVPAK